MTVEIIDPVFANELAVGKQTVNGAVTEKPDISVYNFDALTGIGVSLPVEH